MNQNLKNIAITSVVSPNQFFYIDKTNNEAIRKCAQEEKQLQTFIMSNYRVRGYTPCVGEVMRKSNTLRIYACYIADPAFFSVSLFTQDYQTNGSVAWLMK